MRNGKRDHSLLNLMKNGKKEKIMSASDAKYIRANIEYDYDDAQIGLQPVSLGDIIDTMQDWELEQYGLVRIVDKKGKNEISQYCLNTLSNHGWINVKREEEVNKKKVMKNEFFVTTKFGMHGIDISNLSQVQLHYLLEGKLLQVVEPETVLPEEMRKKFKAEVKKRAEREKTAAAKKEKIAQRRKAKAIQKAKALLQKEGAL